MSETEKSKFSKEKNNQFKKCSSCPDAKRVKHLYKENKNILKKFNLSMKDIKTRHSEIFTSHFADNRMSFLFHVTGFYRQKIEEIINNDGAVEDLKKIIIDFETAIGN